MKLRQAMKIVRHRHTRKYRTRTIRDAVGRIGWRRMQGVIRLESAMTAAQFFVFLKSTSANRGFEEIEITRNMETVLPDGWDLSMVDPSPHLQEALLTEFAEAAIYRRGKQSYQIPLNYFPAKRYP